MTLPRSFSRVRAGGPRPRVAALVSVAVLSLTACTSGSPAAGPAASSPASPAAARSGSAAPAPSGAASAGAGASSTASPTSPASPTGTAPSGSASSPAAPLPAVTDPVSLPALMRESYTGHDLRVGRVLRRTDAYTRHAVTFRSTHDLRISGIINIPAGKGPFPVLVLAHGYIAPSAYHTGQGLMREQDYLARRGYVVLHVDYRNHASSDKDPKADVNLTLGYTEDVINAVQAVKAAKDPAFDTSRLGLLGRSLGGGVVLNVLVVKPGLVDAAVIYDPVSSDTVDNFDKWTRPRGDLAAQIIEAHGSPASDPAFWRGVSSRTYAARATEPLLIHHGTADSTCPLRWSRETLAAFEAGGDDATLVTYRGEEHAFGPQWPASMRRTTAFFRSHLRA